MFVSCPHMKDGERAGLYCNQRYNSCENCGIAHPELKHKKEITKKKKWFLKIFSH